MKNMEYRWCTMCLGGKRKKNNKADENESLYFQNIRDKTFEVCRSTEHNAQIPCNPVKYGTNGLQ